MSFRIGCKRFRYIPLLFHFLQSLVYPIFSNVQIHSTFTINMTSRAYKASIFILGNCRIFISSIHFRPIRVAGQKWIKTSYIHMNKTTGWIALIYGQNKGSANRASSPYNELFLYYYYGVTLFPLLPFA